MDKFVWGSVAHQKQLAGLLGYDWEQYDPADDDSVHEFWTVCVQALISGKDKTGKALSVDDMSLLSQITGRG